MIELCWRELLPALSLMLDKVIYFYLLLFRFIDIYFYLFISNRAMMRPP